MLNNFKKKKARPRFAVVEGKDSVIQNGNVEIEVEK